MARPQILGSGHSTLRIRVPKSMQKELEEVAEQESAETGQTITMSSIARAAIRDALDLRREIIKVKGLANLSDTDTSSRATVVPDGLYARIR